jgi:hypothetical protein
MLQLFIHIFGGRGVDGADLGNLAACKISSQFIFISCYGNMLIILINRRWYMFQNMGPAPTVRSWYHMAAVGTWVFVLGGELSVSGLADDSTVIHVLDTSAFTICSTSFATAETIPRAHQVS